MFDETKLKDVLHCYKRDFEKWQWGNEKYKWEAIRCFQDNWDINAADFADMLSRSLAKTYNLLASMNNFPRRMIEGFAKQATEEVKAMFLALFDEKQNVVGRILAFKDQAHVLLEKYGNGARQHYQNENSITTYLWLRYPDRYYVYKYSEIRKAAEKLGADFSFKKGDYAENLRKFYAFYDALCVEVKKNDELKTMLKEHLTDTCYEDPELRTLTADIGFYVSRYYGEHGKASEEEWWPDEEDYDPGIAMLVYNYRWQ